MTFKTPKQIPPVLYIYVADRARVRCFAASWPGATQWKEVMSIEFAEGAQHARDVVTDGPGTFGERYGGHHGGEAQTDHRHQSADRFAAQIVDHMEKSRSNNEFGKVAIVAPPLFLGAWRNKLPSPLEQMVILELNKDYTSSSMDEIAEHVCAKLGDESQK